MAETAERQLSIALRAVTVACGDPALLKVDVDRSVLHQALIMGIAKPLAHENFLALAAWRRAFSDNRLFVWHGLILPIFDASRFGGYGGGYGHIHHSNAGVRLDTHHRTAAISRSVGDHIARPAISSARTIALSGCRNSVFVPASVAFFVSFHRLISRLTSESMSTFPPDARCMPEFSMA